MLRAIVDDLTHRARLPLRRGDGDPIADAWAAADDVPAMVKLLQLGHHLGIYEVSSPVTYLREPGGQRLVFRLRLPDKRYVRVDFTGGAADLRAIVPTVAPYETWARVIEQIRERITDPIVLLTWDIGRLGVPDPRWAERWTLEEAWRVSASSTAMRKLLGLGGRGDLESKVNQEIAARSPPPKPHISECLDDERRWPAFEAELERWRLAIVRQIVPQLPTLSLPTGEPPRESPRGCMEVPR
jgi:hypothetical protein